MAANIGNWNIEKQGEVRKPAATFKDFGTMRLKLLSTGVAAVVVGGAVYYAYSMKQKTLAEQDKLNVDKAVSVLPPGTQEAWIAYVDRRIAASIQFRAGAISVRDTPDETTFVSRNTPYKVSCSPIMGGSVVFGYGDDSITVSVYDLFYPVSESPPRLGVIASSIAAAKLSRTLCERISASMSKITLL